MERSGRNVVQRKPQMEKSGRNVVQRKPQMEQSGRNFDLSNWRIVNQGFSSQHNRRMLRIREKRELNVTGTNRQCRVT